MLEGMSLGSHLLLVDYTGRLFRDGKAAISAELSGILDRLGEQRRAPVVADGKAWQGPAARPFPCRQSRERLREVAHVLGVHHLANLGGCLANNALKITFVSASARR